MRKLLCFLGIHNYEIHQIVNSKGKFQFFERTCETCNKTQKLQRPVKYHPTKYIFRWNLSNLKKN